jgi:metal-sulfur cluster biosynthetic enzyme
MGAEVCELRESAYGALDRVYDPELDEPITTLGFVAECAVDEQMAVSVVLRLPTPQCAPNFGYLMAADARREVERVPGVSRVEVRLEDHFMGHEINDGVRRGLGFAAAFPGEAEDEELASLRSLFRRKALVARQAAICESMLKEGAEMEEIAAKKVADLPSSPDAVRSLELRAALGIGTDPDSPGLVTAAGEVIEPAALARWYRMARLVRTGLEANGGICRSLLLARDTGGAAAEVAA